MDIRHANKWSLGCDSHLYVCSPLSLLYELILSGSSSDLHCDNPAILPVSYALKHKLLVHIYVVNSAESAWSPNPIMLTSHPHIKCDTMFSLQDPSEKVHSQDCNLSLSMIRALSTLVPNNCIEGMLISGCFIMTDIYI